MLLAIEALQQKRLQPQLLFCTQNIHHVCCSKAATLCRAFNFAATWISVKAVTPEVRIRDLSHRLKAILLAQFVLGVTKTI